MSVDLEKFCIIQPYESAWLPPYDGKWQHLRPGHSRKVYPSLKKGRRIYMGATLEPGDEIRQVREIAKLVDKRPLSDLLAQTKDAMTQMLYRAHCGDRDALLQYILHTRAAVASLQTLANHLPAKVRAQAETFSDWPVLLSLNPQDITSAKEQLKSLGVGKLSPLPTKPGQRWDRRNFWTRLAEQAVTACADNKRRVPALKGLSAGAKPWRETIKFWGIRVNATYYMLANGDMVMITDWQNKCVKLSAPITDDNYPVWWDVVKSCVLDYWKNPKGNYAEALKKVGRANEEDYVRRNLAIDRVEQALRSRLGLQ